jgi:uncharacterized membrane protein YccC
LYLLNDLERLDGLIRRLRPDDPGSAAARTAAGDLLRDCAAALRAGDAAPLAGAEAPVLHGYDPPERLRAVAGSAAAHTAALLEDRPRSAGATVDDAIRRLRAHLSLHSVHARDAVRTGFGLGAACALAGAFSLAHGFWVALATLTVLRSSLRATARRVGAAVAGTVVGSAAAFLLVEAVGSRTGLYAALLPVVVAVAIAANAGVGFLAGQAGFTVAIVVLFNLLAPAGWHIGILRVEDVAAGALTGAVAGVLAWPRGAGAELPAAVGALTRTGRAYLAASVRALAGGDADPGVSQALDRARRPAMVAAVRVDADLAQYLAEAPAPEEAAAWAAAAAAGHRLWYVADLLRTCDARPVSDPVVLMAAADRILAPDGDPRTGADRAWPQSGSAPQGDPLLDWLDDLGTSSVPRPV